MSQIRSLFADIKERISDYRYGRAVDNTPEWRAFEATFQLNSLKSSLSDPAPRVEQGGFSYSEGMK